MNERTIIPLNITSLCCISMLFYSISMFTFRFSNFFFHFQVNHSPSFTTDSPLDKEIKDGLMYDALNLLNFGACDRRKILEEDKKRVRDRLLQKQRPKENKYVKMKYQFAAEVVMFTLLVVSSNFKLL